jgi:hypothetical protein
MLLPQDKYRITDYEFFQLWKIIKVINQFFPIIIYQKAS